MKQSLVFKQRSDSIFAHDLHLTLFSDNVRQIQLGKWLDIPCNMKPYLTKDAGVGKVTTLSHGAGVNKYVGIYIVGQQKNPVLVLLFKA